MKNRITAALLPLALIALTGCGDSSPISTAQLDAEGFTDKVADAFFCYTYASSTKRSAQEIQGHADYLMRMQARKFCDAPLVDYYTCFSVRKLLTGSGAGCVQPNPVPTQEAILACANSVATSLAHAQKRLMENAANQGDRMAATYKSQCAGGKAQSSGLRSY